MNAGRIGISVSSSQINVLSGNFLIGMFGLCNREEGCDFRFDRDLICFLHEIDFSSETFVIRNESVRWLSFSCFTKIFHFHRNARCFARKVLDESLDV